MGDPTKPYFTSDTLDGAMIGRIRYRAELYGRTLSLDDGELLRAIRAIQDADVHLGSTRDPVGLLIDLLFGPLGTTGLLATERV